MSNTTQLSDKVPTTRRISGWAKRRPVLAAVAGITALSLTGTGAYAYWTQSGSGTGTGTAGTTVNVPIVGTIAGTLSPGNSNVISFTATNPNNTPITVGTISATTFSSSVSACATAIDLAETTPGDEWFTMANVTSNQLLAASAAAGTAITATGTVVFQNRAVNQDVCKGAPITVTLAASAVA